MKMSDFPAAHSMDTYWFAIDADENVAVFDSGEDGAVPYSARKLIEKKKILDIYGLLDYLPKDESGIVQLKTSGKTAAKNARRKNIIKECRDRDWLPEMLFVLSNEKVIHKLRSQRNIILRFAGEPVVIYLQSCRARKIKKLIESGEIIGCKQVSLWRDSYLLGLFGYENVGYYIPAPYLRETQPETRLKLKDLPKNIQDMISLTWFDELRFQDAKMIQPIEYSQCNTWGGIKSWVDTKGQIHGNVENLEEVQEDIANWLEQLKQE